jgi:alpha-glucuronidase
MRTKWAALENNIDKEIFEHVQEKLKKQEKDAGTWRDTCISYFQKFSEKPVPAFN